MTYNTTLPHARQQFTDEGGREMQNPDEAAQLAREISHAVFTKMDKKQKESFWLSVPFDMKLDMPWKQYGPHGAYEWFAEQIEKGEGEKCH